MEKEDLKIRKERRLTVVKKNEVVQKWRYNLNLQQQKTILYLIAKLDPMKEVQFQKIRVSIKDLCEVMGIRYNGKNLDDIKSAIRKLADNSIWVDSGKDSTLVRWLQHVTIEKGEGSAVVEFDEFMAPYLLQIHERFTQYPLENVLPMKSAYSIRLYELIKSHQEQGEWDVSLEELRRVLFITEDTYQDYRVFRKRVLDNAVTEICNFTDLIVAYTTKRVNRKISSILFVMCDINSEDFREGRRRMLNRDMVLDHLQSEVITPKNMPTVQTIRDAQQRKKEEQAKMILAEKYRRAKRTQEEDPTLFMPSQINLFE